MAQSNLTVTDITKTPIEGVTNKSYSLKGEKLSNLARVNDDVTVDYSKNEGSEKKKNHQNLFLFLHW